MLGTFLRARVRFALHWPRYTPPQHKHGVSVAPLHLPRKVLPHFPDRRASHRGHRMTTMPRPGGIGALDRRARSRPSRQSRRGHAVGKTGRSHRAATGGGLDRHPGVDDPTSTKQDAFATNAALRCRALPNRALPSANAATRPYYQHLVTRCGPRPARRSWKRTTSPRAEPAWAWITR